MSVCDNEGRNSLKTKVLLILILLSAVILSSCARHSIDNSPPENKKTDYDWSAAYPSEKLKITSVDRMSPEMRGVWIATVHNINFPSAPDISEEQLKNELDEIVRISSQLGLNTIFFQAHPSSDALYKSTLFPVSAFLTSGNSLYFDPLEYITNECHKNGIQLFAWVNPFRVSTASYESKEQAIETQKKVRSNTELMVYYNDGRLYYDPGNQDVTALISDCVFEIVSGYDVDGIVFDDYFYPYPCGEVPFDDAESYRQNSNGLSLEEWRRENINRVIHECYKRIKAADPECLFGVAPFGIWKNDNGENGGSATFGLEGYNSLYCDALAWADGGYVDFISPQIYWSNEESAAPFDVLCEWWDSALSGTGVAFIPSLAAYKYEGGWDEPSGEMARQISLCRPFSTYRGSVYYGFEAIRADASGITKEISALNSEFYLYQECVRYPSDLRTAPAMTGVVFEEKRVGIKGISPANAALNVNNHPIKADMRGTFSFQTLLSPGENIVTLTCGTDSQVLRMFMR